jgi:hypothetical protein
MEFESEMPGSRKPRRSGAFRYRLLEPVCYCRLAIRLSSADFGGRVSDSGNCPSG